MLRAVAIVCGVAIATLGERTSVDWVGCTQNYDLIRSCVSRTVLGFAKCNE